MSDDLRAKLARLLDEIWSVDPSAHTDRDLGADREQVAYAERNRLIWQAAGLAAELGYPVGCGVDPTDVRWVILYLELPTGQCSWHLPEHAEPWDGHSTALKYLRTHQYVHHHGQPVDEPADPAVVSLVLLEIAGHVRYSGLTAPLRLEVRDDGDRIAIQVPARMDVDDWADLLDTTTAETHAGQYATTGLVAGVPVDIWWEPDQPAPEQSAYGLDLARAVATDRSEHPERYQSGGDQS